MLAARNNLSMCVTSDEKLCFAGSLSGQILTIDIDDFAYRDAVQAHAGGIHAITSHPVLPYVAAMSTERSVSLWRRERDGSLKRLAYIDVRDLVCSNDEVPIPYIQSTSQALAFHPTERRLLTRTGAGGLLEIAFEEDGSWEQIQCIRFHGTEDLVQARYLEGSDQILTMANYGEVAVSDHGEVLRKWRFGWHNVHWAEHLEGDDYLLASDTRQVIRLDVSGRKAPIVGPHLTRDDLEHVTFNRSSKKAYIAGFDSNVYEISTSDCSALGIVYKAPYKCRWVKTLERDPDVMILQCRNGGMHKASLAKGARTALIKDTPEAIWTAAAMPDNSLIMAGDARAFYRLRLGEVDHQSRIPEVIVRREPIAIEGDGHFKRLDVQSSTGLVVAGRSDGQIWVGDGAAFRPLCRIDLPVRDLCVHPEKPEFYVAGEDAVVRKFDIASGAEIDSFRSPIGEQFWTIAYNPTHDLLAFAEREGSVHIVRGSDFRLLESLPDVRRPKRMKWRDANTLLWSRSVELHRFDLDTGKSGVFVRETGNTIEDFIWDEERRYLVALNYNCLIILCNYRTGEFIDVTPDSMDYSKGLIWLPRTRDSYPLDFVSIGRTGVANLFRIHDEKILPLWPVTRSGWAAAPGDPRNGA